MENKGFSQMSGPMQVTWSECLVKNNKQVLVGHLIIRVVINVTGIGARLLPGSRCSLPLPVRFVISKADDLCCKLHMPNLLMQSSVRQ